MVDAKKDGDPAADLDLREDVNAGIDAFQKVVMRYKAATKKVVRRSEKWSLASSAGYHLGENDYIFDVVQIYFFESK